MLTNYAGSNYVCQKNPIGYSKDQHWCISNVTTTQPQTVNLTVLSNYSIMVVTTILSSKGWGNFHAYGVLLAEASSTVCTLWSDEVAMHR